MRRNYAALPRTAKIKVAIPPTTKAESQRLFTKNLFWEMMSEDGERIYPCFLKQAVHLAKFFYSFQREFRDVSDCFKRHLAPQHFQYNVRLSLFHALCLCFLCNVLCKIFHRFAHDPSPFLCFLKKSYPFCQYIIIHILGSRTAKIMHQSAERRSFIRHGTVDINDMRAILKSSVAASYHPLDDINRLSHAQNICFCNEYHIRFRQTGVIVS